MFAWIAQNIVTIIVIAVLLLIVGAAIFVMARDKRRKTGGCTGNCANCPMCCSHTKTSK